jgi:hypothetical protein
METSWSNRHFTRKGFTTPLQQVAPVRLYPAFPSASAFAGSVAENFPVNSLTAGYLGVGAAGDRHGQLG